MSLYNKKLHIKKPNNQIQIANLYTDKSDVGNNYLTFKDGNNIIYSALDVNGDIDCKVNKNNISYKIKKESSNVPTAKQNFTTEFDFTIPNGVKVIKLTVLSLRDVKKILYVKVNENHKYTFSTFASSDSPDEVVYLGDLFLQVYDLFTNECHRYNIVGSGFQSSWYEIKDECDCLVEYSNEINNHKLDYYVNF